MPFVVGGTASLAMSHMFGGGGGGGGPGGETASVDPDTIPLKRSSTLCIKTSLIAVPLLFIGCGPVQQQPGPPAREAPPLHVSIGNLSRGSSAYVGQSVQVKLAAGGYDASGPTLAVRSTDSPTLNLIVFFCRESIPDNKRAVWVKGTVRPVVVDGKWRGPEIVGEVVVVDCTVTVDP